jgi:hypothetical protein
MHGIHEAEPGFDHLRQRGALRFFRLANCILRAAINLHQMRAMPRASVRLAVLVSGWLEKAGAVLLFGPRRYRREDNLD